MDIPIRLGYTSYIPDIFIVYTTWYILSIYHQYTMNIFFVYSLYITGIYHGYACYITGIYLVYTCIYVYIPGIYIVYYAYILHPVAGVAEEGSTENTGNHILTSPGRDITST